MCNIKNKNFRHTSVLLDDAVRGLNICSCGIYFDGTFGMGGHSKVILSQLSNIGRLLIIDCDLESINLAKKYFAHDNRVTIVHGFFSNIIQYSLAQNILGKVNGILLDFGLSSAQIDDSLRGFSFMQDGPLDMRFNVNYGQSASEWLYSASVENISWVFRNLGEERFANRLAKEIVKKRRYKSINTTKILSSLISDVLPYRNNRIKSIIRIFRAIRMYVNDELGEIQKVLDSSLKVLSPKGRLSVISFNSIEDRIVKNFIRKYSCYSFFPSDLPITELKIKLNYSNKIKLRNIGRILPSCKEKMNNPRSRSAILRIAEKI